MCSNYRPVTRMDRLLTFFGVEYPQDEPERDVYPLGAAPFIRLVTEGEEGGVPALVADSGTFGLLPHWAELKHGRKTYNARTETVAKLASFRDAWKKGHRCIIPAEAIYEPCYETGSAVRWRIGQEHDIPLGIAGIYSSWKNPEGKWFYTFAMLTVNAEGHPLMQRMHAPTDEKRMVVILDPVDYEGWLKCSVLEAPRYFRQWHGPLVGEPAPASRAAKVLRTATPPPAKPPVQGDLL
jgi:putative SOS response-associated peptidase YedK